MVKISIREQLAAAFLLTSLLSLMVLALSTWFQNKSFVTNIRLTGLSLTASLKAAQLSSTLLLYKAQVRSMSTRILIQSALQNFNEGINTNENWVRPQSDLESALSSGPVLVQGIIFPSFDTGNISEQNGLLNVTSNLALGTVKLPYAAPDGSDVYLGDAQYGYPPSLYPNLTYSANASNSSATAYVDGTALIPDGVLYLGPLVINQTFALMSVTTAIMNNTNKQEILGWLSVVVESSMLSDIINSPEGLGNSGEVLVVGPESVDNHFQFDVRNASQVENLQNQDVRFLFPPSNASLIAGRHSDRLPPKNASAPFPVSSFPAVLDVWSINTGAVNNAGAIISTHNEQNVRVSVGYAQVNTEVVDWVVIVEEDHGEVVSPINHLRDVVLICVFSVTGGLLLTIFPLAHYSITPIRQLKAATSKTVEPYQPDDASAYTTSSHAPSPDERDDDDGMDHIAARKEGFLGMITMFKGKTHEKYRPSSSTRRRRTFRIPSKVPERKHWITDELTDLTSTFNEMSDELTMQYERLEERVKERTAELERSKQAAEAANQSKTLFIANISHELKTPLNGILGLTTVCMNEDDISKIRPTLNTIYKSGDLLLHLLTDLLTFSKNEVGQQLSIDEAEFRLADLSTQLMPTFDKQAREGQIDLKVLYIGLNDAFGNSSDEAGEKAFGPLGTGRVKDMCLWGDKNRILQVLMNFVSNSLKFTPPHGSVTVRVKCLGLAENVPKSNTRRQSSLASRRSKSSSKKRVRTSDTSLIIPNIRDDNKPRSTTNSVLVDDAKLSINVAGGTTHIAKVVQRQRSMSPPPLNTKDLVFEFEVEDTGPGIPEDQQSKIFEPFVQGDLGLSKKYGGTGLGLSICAQLAALMGGEISLDSKVGVGSKFTMTLPMRYTAERAGSISSGHRTMSKASSMVGGPNDDPDGAAQTSLSKEDAEAKVANIPRIVGFTQPYVAKEVKQDCKNSNLNVMKRAESEAAKDGRKVRVLVAEDNKINQEVVLRMLKLEEVYDVTIAKDGQEAFEQVRDSMQTGQKFHLIFMDVQMPNVDGIQSTKLIRRMGFSAPIVALTAFAEKSNEDECMASGMDYFLAKPIRRPALKHVLKKYCTTIVEEEGEATPASTPPKEEGINGDITGQNGTAKFPKKRPAVDTADSGNVSPMS